jgi:DNA-binding NtrC family response regulator
MLVGTSAEMRWLRARLALLASWDIPILIWGESGTTREW